MKRTARLSALFAGALVFALLVVASSAARAADDITSSDLEAAGRAIAFLNNLPNDGTIVVGIVAVETPDGRAKAAQAAALFERVQRPGVTTFRTVLIGAKDLAQTTGRLDAILLMPNQVIPAGDIANAVRRRHVASISTDPSCIGAKCCVLLVQTAGRVRIVLNTALANAVGAQFSSIFMMMVERR